MILFFFAFPAFATENRMFYVPYMPGAKTVYGAYRLIAHTADYNTAVVSGNLSYKTKSVASDKNVTDVFQSADLVRSDLIILTKNGVRVTGVRDENGTTYNDTVYYETPEFVIGYFFDGSPAAGSSVMQLQGRPYFVAAKISDLTKLFAGVPEIEILKSLVNYQGLYPQGSRIALGANTFVVSQNPSRFVFNWWQELSQEFLAGSMADIKSFGWREISEYYGESAYANGRFAQLPLKNASVIPSSKDMVSLWSAKKGSLGKSSLPEHFTDFMMSVSPGVWVSSGKTFTSCDPEMLLRWLYEIPQKKGTPQIRVSANVSTDFSAFKKADPGLYEKIAVTGDPNVLFSFSPFEVPVKSSVSIFFPYEKKYADSRKVSQTFGETASSIAALPESIRKGAEEGAGKFVGNTENYLFGTAGCMFVPADRNEVIKMLRSKGFDGVLKSLGISESGLFPIWRKFP